MTKQTARLKNNNIRREEYATSRWAINVPAGTTLKDLVSPDFYTNIASQLRKNDYIRALFDDGSHVVDLLVVEVDTKNQTPVWVKTIITNLVNIAEAHAQTAIIAKTEENTKEVESKKNPEISHPDYEIKFRGIRKHSIIRKSDSTVLQDNFLTKEAANDALKELIEKLAS